MESLWFKLPYWSWVAMVDVVSDTFLHPWEPWDLFWTVTGSKTPPAILRTRSAGSCNLRVSGSPLVIVQRCQTQSLLSKHPFFLQLQLQLLTNNLCNFVGFALISVCVCVCCHVWLFVHSMGCSLPDPLSMGFSRREYWSGLPCPPPRNLPDPGIEPMPPALAGRFSTTVLPEKPWSVSYICSPVEHNSSASWICVSQVIVLSLARI